MKVYKNH